MPLADMHLAVFDFGERLFEIELHDLLLESLHQLATQYRQQFAGVLGKVLLRLQFADAQQLFQLP